MTARRTVKHDRNGARIAAIYCRISKDDKVTTLGVQRQEKLCREMAAQRGIDVAHVFIDNDRSAYKRGSRRPAYEAMMAAADAGQINTVICYHVNRLYRRMEQLEGIVETVERTRLDVLTVMAGDFDLGTASGRMTARILASVAQGEVEQQGERLCAKNDELAAAGKPPGGRRPYGYTDGYAINPDEAKWLNHAVTRIMHGWSLMAVCRELTAMGVPSRDNKNWHYSTLRTMLINPAIAGLRVHRGEIAGPAAWEPLVDRHTWETLRSTLADPRRRQHRTGGPYLLSGLVYTPGGRKMNGCLRRGRRLYAARHDEKATTPPAQIDADALDAAVTAALLARMDHAELPTTESQPDDEVEAIEAEMTQLAKLRGDGVVSMDEWVAARVGIQRRLDAARAARSANGHRVALPAIQGPLRASWGQLDVAQQQTILREVIERVTIKPAGRNRYMPLIDRLHVEFKA